jgi:type II secretory pathway component PulF
MAAREPSSLGRLSLDELIALTDEMAALVRAGVPLESGLAQVALDMARRPCQLAALLAGRMQRGESLEHILSSSPETFPSAYCAVVKAGVRTGRLSTALEGLAVASRRASELRRLTRMALLYPIFIALLAYGLFVGCLFWFQPQVTQLYRAMHVAASQLNLGLSALGRNAEVWMPWIPLVAIVALSVWWYRSSSATARQPRWLQITPAGRLLHASQLATFTDLLALLIESETPLPEAVVLAAEAGGDRQLLVAAREFATKSERGAFAQPQLAKTDNRIAGFPPLVNWLLTGGNQATLAESLRTTASAYRRRAIRLDDWLRMYLPLGLTIAIGGSAVLVYALSMLGPWYQMLLHLAQGGAR